MSLARDQFYNSAIRPNLARFSTKIKVGEILPHLPCLTDTDKEEIEAKKDSSGNYMAVQKLLENLRRRENWPDEFITALRNCEQRELADEISDIYDKIRGIKNAPKPAATPAPPSTGAAASFTKVTIHTAPPTTAPLLIPPAEDTPEHLAMPSNPETQKPTPAPVQVPNTQQVAQVTSPALAHFPKPVSQAKTKPLEITSPTPSPVVVLSPAQQGAPTHTEEADNKTPALNVLDGLGLTNQASNSLSSSEFPLTTTGAQASTSNASQIQPPKLITTPQSSENIQVPREVKDIDTSVRLSVQDTNPPLRQERTLQRPEVIYDPTPNEVVQRNTVGFPISNAHINSTRTAQATTSAPIEVVAHTPSSNEQEYFSKPGILHHAVPQREGTLPVLQEDPCSVVSGDLEISRETASSTESRQATSLGEQTSTAIASFDSASQPLNNPAALLNHNQPEENHYESVCESQTLVNVIRFAEEPPAENLNGQPPSMLQRSRVMSVEPPTLNHVGIENPAQRVVEASSLKKSTAAIGQEQESNAGILQPEQREEGRPELFRLNNVHIAAAAGVALFAILLVWKLKQ